VGAATWGWVVCGDVAVAGHVMLTNWPPGWPKRGHWPGGSTAGVAAAHSGGGGG